MEPSPVLNRLWPAVLERFEQQAPASVMARLLLEQAFPAEWIDDVFDAHHGSQYALELMFSTVVDLMMLVVVGLRPSLYAAARQSETLPVSLAALYDKVKRTEPDLLRALVSASAERLAPVLVAALGGPAPRLAGTRFGSSTATIGQPARSGWAPCAELPALPCRGRRS